MSFAFVQRQKMMRRPWGAFKVWVWDLWTSFLAWYDIDAGEMPKSWSKGT